MKTHNIKYTTANNEKIPYFYTREKRDRNGNGRYRVFMIDNETSKVYERIFQCYESQIAECVTNYIENYMEG